MFGLKARKLELEKEIILLETKRETTKTALELETSLTQMKINLSEVKIEHKEELRTISHEKKVADEDIKHMVKMQQERLELEYEKKVLSVTQEKELAVAKVKDSYRDKMEKQLKEETQNIERKFESILKRLPNVNVRLKGDA